ncbi:MAG: hypothetical protein ACXW02_05020 [Halobacteriota archaeon]
MSTVPTEVLSIQVAFDVDFRAVVIRLTFDNADDVSKLKEALLTA